MPKSIIWTITDLAEIVKHRQNNEFDCIIAWSGARGNGKSSGAFRLSKRFKEKFNPWKHIIYSRRDAMKLLEKTKYGVIMDDEAIRSVYKRNFQDPEQKLIVQMLNMYRDNFNLYNICVPKFYALDKDLRDLVKIHIHVVERGLGVVHIAREDVLYSDDPWDIAYNQKIEAKWAERIKKNPNFKPPYHKLTTFAGYLVYGAMTKKQEVLYKAVKQKKRSQIYNEQIVKEANIKQEKENKKSKLASVTTKVEQHPNYETVIKKIIYKPASI